jgi:hypothetical protein
MFKYLKKIENKVKNNKMLLGILIITINVISRNIKINLTPFQKYLIDNVLIRQLFIFCVTFIGTKDLKISLLLTGSFYVLSSHLLHEESPFSLVPKRFRDAVDTNNDNDISSEEIDKAIDTLEKVKMNKNEE